MKKLTLLVMPLMTISFLASCIKGGGDDPEPEPTEYTLALALNDCNVSGESTYSKKYNKGSTIDDVIVSPNDDFALTDDSVGDTYQQYWKASTDGNYVLSDLVMNSNCNITITATPVTPPGPTEYAITYHYDGGQGETEPSSYTIEDNVTLPTPTAMKVGYDAFDGWYFDEAHTQSAGTGWSAGEQLGNKDLYAKYTTPTTYTITYHMPEGASKGDNPDSYTIETDTITLGNATKKGYTFDGWHIGSVEGELITSIPKGSTGSYDLYTTATAVSYDIEYVLNGGTSKGNNPDSYTIEDTITLQAATGDQTFVGWHLQEDLKDTVITGWNKGDKIDKVTLYAEWSTTPPGPTKYTLTATCVNGTVDGNEGEYEKDEEVVLTFVPDSGYSLPQSLDEFELIGIDKSEITYKTTTGRMIFNMPANIVSVKVTATSPEPHTKHTLTAICNNGTVTGEGEYEENTDVVLTFNANQGYNLPTSKDDIEFVNIDKSAVTYDSTTGALSFKMPNKAVLVTVTATNPEPATLYTLTFNARDGSFYETIKKFNFKVEEGTNLSFFLHNGCKIIPTLEGNLFGYYSVYAPGHSIDLSYEYTVDRDLNLDAYYFPITEPYDDLDLIPASGDDRDARRWDTIQKVAITNPDPHTCFKIGATKGVFVNTCKHMVRIIGFNHDEVSSDSPSDPIRFAGITFEFATEISNHEGDAIYFKWDNDNCYNFPSSVLNEKLNGNGSETEDTVYDMMPNCLKDKIVKAVKKVGKLNSNEKNKSYKATPYSCHLFPLSLIELVGEDYFERLSDTVKGEGTTYEYYVIHHDYNHGDWSKFDYNGGHDSYWFRSPCTRERWLEDDIDAFCLNNSYKEESYISNFYVGSTYTIAPAFCI